MRAVLDTGVLVSALIRRDSLPGQVLLALRNKRFTALYSVDILEEIVEVLSRQMFREKYHIEPQDIVALVNLIRLWGELVIPSKRVKACRDPKDDKFLEAAVEGEADWLVTGDADLLDIKSFNRVEMINPRAFLERLDA